MRAVFALVLVFGMALAGVAVYMAQGYMSQTEAKLARATETQRKTGKLVQVYAAKAPLKFGDALSADLVQPIYVQEQFLPDGAFLVEPPAAAAPATPGTAAPAAEPAKASSTDAEKPKPAAEALFPTDTNKPRFLTRSVEANEILLFSRVTAPGEAASLTGKLEPGMRAFQIKVDVASGVSGFVMPESYIDIYWTGASSSNVSGEVTRLIESAVRVIAVDSASGEGQMTGGNGGARTVTVAASAEQVARLAQAQATGRLAMSLVASSADAVSGLVEVDRDKLLGVEQQEVVVVEAPEVCTIKTRKGPDVVEVPIPCTN